MAIDNMNLLNLVGRTTNPLPWSQGEKIPWDEPGFSQRMLKEHLTQSHDAASRRFEVIDHHIQWIHKHVLKGKPRRILDLGCGPGLYTSRLTKLGHRCRGIDFSPASIAYAESQVQKEGLEIGYQLGDMREVDYDGPYELVMLIFGEFNVFHPVDARLILEKAWRALETGGMLLLEPHTFEAVVALGKESSSWYTSESGLFSDRPHLCLQENFWDEEQKAATNRYFIIDAQDGSISQHAMSVQAYMVDEYKQLLHDCGFTQPEFFPGLGADSGYHQRELIAITASKVSDD
jgi:SAM-dependent methyltransferase